MKINPYLIPIYGLMLGLREHHDAGARHSRACQKFRETHSSEDYEATWRAMEKTWPAMDHALLGLYATIFELLIIIFGGLAVGVMTGILR